MVLKIIFWILAVIGFLLALDRLLLYLEIKGWIYYRRKKPNPGSVGNVCLEIQQLLEPSKKYVIQVKKEEKKEQQESGERKEEPEN
ncbi:MAG: hypothetical protein ACUVRL_10050 [Candidatus Saccharicenans sp.]|uniref:hypothetical protein n=1 Tax=Candidatus Saccharicenans sp. TaxID=2819258 RepID=UPI00404B5467